MNWQSIFARVLQVVSLISGLVIGGGFWNFIKAVPTLWRIGKIIMSVFHDTEDYIERVQKAKQFEAAIAKAKASGDTSDLEKLFGGSGHA